MISAAGNGGRSIILSKELKPCSFLMLVSGDLRTGLKRGPPDAHDFYPREILTLLIEVRVFSTATFPVKVIERAFEIGVWSDGRKPCEMATIW